MSLYTEITVRFQQQHAEMAAALEGLPAEALDWVPGPEMNSIAGLIVHTLGSERRLLGGLALQDPPAGPRQEEFGLRGLGAEELKARLAAADAWLGSAEARLATLNPDDKRIARNNQERTVAWAILHALEHSAEHLGHIQLTRQLWQQQAK